ATMTTRRASRRPVTRPSLADHAPGAAWPQCLCPVRCRHRRSPAAVRARTLRGAVDLSFSPAEVAFRAEVRQWLRANVPDPPLPSGDTREGFAAHLAWE